MDFGLLSKSFTIHFISFSSRSNPINKKVLLIGEDSHVCDNIRVFLEATRIPYHHLKNQPDNELPLLYDKNLIPNFTSFIFCSFRSGLFLTTKYSWIYKQAQVRRSENKPNKHLQSYI